MRLSLQDWALRMAHVVSLRSTCLRRSVGCVLLDGKGRVLSTGYNGVSSGQAHCNELARTESGDAVEGIYPHACPAAAAPSGRELEGCRAIHAEQNALLQCRDIDAIEECYSTTEPCAHCAKLLLNTGCQRVYFLTPYPQGDGFSQWRAGRPNGVWLKLLI